MKDKLISVIVPMYNSSIYIEKCIHSICNQTYRNLEIIIVDDGSQDDSYDKCLLLAQQDSRIKLLNQSNSGQSVARNYALDVMKGDYVYFADSDDYLEPTLIEELFCACENNLASIAMCDYRKIFSDKSVVYKHELCQGEILSKEKAMNLLSSDIVITNFLWNKIFKTNLWNNVRFPVGRLFEDYAVMHILFDNADKTAYVNKELYNYVWRSTSSIHGNMTEKRIEDALCAYTERLQFIQNKYPQYIKNSYESLCKEILSLYEVCLKTNSLSECKNTLLTFENKYLNYDDNKNLKPVKLRLFFNHRQLYISAYMIYVKVFLCVRSLYRAILKVRK